MTLRWDDRQRDRVLALLAGGFALQYTAAARGIEDSLLSDAVGAGGVPQGAGFLMLAASVALFAKSFIGKAPAEDGSDDIGDSGDGDGGSGGWKVPLQRTSGLVLILIAYGLLLPWLGYPLSVSLLFAAVGALAGAALRWPLFVCAGAAGPLMWAIFDQALQVRMPLGTLWS